MALFSRAWLNLDGVGRWQGPNDQAMREDALHGLKNGADRRFGNPCILPGPQDETQWNSREKAQNTQKR
ncbi:MAG: hypothetical protein WCT12_33395, partial [Verrucomicrobiota bacterium]